MLDSSPESLPQLGNEISDYFSRNERNSSLKDFDVDEFPKGKTIYHYTTAAGLLGILQSRMIWATEASYLNDSQEIKYGVDLAVEELNKLFEEKSVEDYRELIDTVTQKLLIFGQSEIYVSFLCEDGDLLSKWKGYSDFGAGFSIGLNVDQFLISRPMLSASPIRIKKVVYDAVIQKRILWDEFNATLGQFDDWRGRYPKETMASYLPAAATGLTEYIKLQLVRFKAKAFEEEKEWRMIFYPFFQDVEYKNLIRFRIVGNRIIPYLEFQLPTISEIVRGPKIDRESSRKAIDLIYERASIPPPQLSESKINLQ